MPARDAPRTAANSPGLVALYRSDEGDGVVATDSAYVDGPENGTVIGATWIRTGLACSPIDIGAYEFQGMTPPNCPADWNTDGSLNSQDFFDFITAFFSGC